MLKLAFVLAAVAGLGSGQIQAPVTPQSGPTTTRSIEGLVSDGKGTVVANAVVLLKDTKTLQVRSYLAGKDGRYRFFGLSSDINYEVRAQAGDMTSKSKSVSVFDSHKIIRLNLKLNKKKKQ